MESFNTKAIASLNQKITTEKIKESIKYLIKFYMIKYTDRDMTEYQTLFDDIMESGYYPTSWNQRLICSVYKLGKNGDQNNYYNLLGRLLNTVLYY